MLDPTKVGSLSALYKGELKNVSQIVNRIYFAVFACRYTVSQESFDDFLRVAMHDHSLEMKRWAMDVHNISYIFVWTKYAKKCLAPQKTGGSPE